MATGATTKFAVKGMDCACCATKIETAVKRIDGVTEIKVGLHTETLSVNLADDEAGAKVEKAIRDLGYDIAPLAASGQASTSDHAGDDYG